MIVSESDKLKAYGQLQDYICRWGLVPEEDLFYTPSSLLQAVVFEGIAAIIKIPFDEEERRGANVMTWWAGNGAAKVFKQDSDAILLERLISNQPSLIERVKNGHDEEATRIICSVAQKLHSITKSTWPSAVPLGRWFQDLEGAARSQGGLFLTSWKYAQELIQSQKEITLLHGDLHHGNVLHSSHLDWLAIDPKGLVGERYFDYANLFCNPDNETALAPGRLINQLGVVSEEAHLDSTRLLKWIIAWAGLSATWSLQDGGSAETALRIAELARRRLTL